MIKQSGLMKVFGAVSAAAVLALFTMAADAQDKKAPPAKSATTKKAPSACQGLDEAACKGKADTCTWIAATKTKAGKPRRAYCRSRPAKRK